MTSECSLQVRTYECDSYGHVNNANYLNYLEVARYEYLKDIRFDYPKAVASGYGLYVARVEIDYKKSAKVDDVLLIKTWAFKKGAVSGILCQEILRGDEIIVTAKVTWAFVNAKTGSPVKIPKEWDLPALHPDRSA
jgi:acyl-CoA thioester hydrolase